jgi:hypothetical protein
MVPQLHFINFPDAATFFKPEFMNRIDSNDRKNAKAILVGARDAIKFEYLTYMDVHWTKVLVAIHKINEIPTKSSLHDDLNHSIGECGARPGINWTLNDRRTLEFWSNDNVIELRNESLPFFTHPIIRYGTDVVADQSYETKAGDVYLLNTGTPHQATSYKESISISIRAEGLDLLTWEQTVELFTKNII